MEYDPEKYWSNVGQQIQDRGADFVAGDNNPYFDYKREKFLTRFLGRMDFDDKVVMEMGPGPGGNLKYIAEHYRCRRLLGADISQTMLDLARKNLSEHHDLVELHKTDGNRLPFDSDSIDTSITVTVLHHVTDEAMFKSAIGELCRVTRGEVVLMEDIGKSHVIGAEGDFAGRRVEVYQAAMAEHGFELGDIEFLKTRASRFWHDLVFFKLYKPFINTNHREGEPISNALRRAIGVPMALTRHLDDHLAENRSLAKMVFRRTD